MLALASSACFHPDPVAGAPCGDGDVCPRGLTCIDGFCVTGDGSGSGDACSGEADGTPCDSAPISECTAQATCLGGACVANDLPAGTACYDCAAGAASCASCAQGECLDSMCDPAGAPRAAELTAPLVANNGEEGSMFDVVATQTITITGFDGHLSATGNTDYEIWTRPGTFVGAADSASGWTKLGMATFAAAGPGEYTPIPIPVSVTLQAGQRQAFYLTNHASNNRYHDGSQVGAAHVSTAELTIYEGAGVNYGTTGFAGTNTPRVWEGKIHYYAGGGTTLATAMTGATSSDGIMFDVNATRDLELSLLAVHLGAGTHDVEVYFRRGSYAGNETTADAWKPLASVIGVVSDGTRATPLPMALGLFVEAGMTTALYVTTTSENVRSQPPAGASAATNADVTIEHGVTVTGDFGGAGAAASPNVELGYGTCN